MFFSQSKIVHWWRIGFIAFLVSLPFSLGYSDTRLMGKLRPTYDSILTPPLKPSVTLKAPLYTPLDHEIQSKIDSQTKKQTGSLAAGVTPTSTVTPSSQPGEIVTPAATSSPIQILLSEYSNQSKEFAKLPQRERAALHAFYDKRQYEFLWTSLQGWTPEAQQLITTLRHASREGLKPSDYHVPSLSPESSLEDRAKADIALSAALVSYARDARGARFKIMGISSKFASPASVFPSVEEVLSKLHSSGDGPQILVDYNPTTIPLYLELRQALNSIRLTPKNTEDSSCSKNKKKCLNSSRQSPQRRAEGKILANMERLRWLPSHLGNFYVMVNIPTFNAYIVSQGHRILTSRVVVGKQATRTPLLSSHISSIVVNPTWYVPASIAPEVRHGRGYKVRQSKYGPLLIQPPGERNALGRLKLIFSNHYGIYMHDTPVRHLFSAPARAFSHGCIRLDNPIHFASSLLAHSTSVSEEISYKKLSRLINTKKEGWVALPNPVSIYVTYITVRIEGDDIVLLRDIYGYDNVMISHL